MREALLLSYLPRLSQADLDHLLWACDLNFVRGEDSVVRAIWAGQPFVWQIYPQHDDAHHDKLNAFLTMLQADTSLQQFHAVWNGLVDPNAALQRMDRVFPEMDPGHGHVLYFRLANAAPASLRSLRRPVEAVLRAGKPPV